MMTTAAGLVFQPGRTLPTPKKSSLGEIAGVIGAGFKTGGKSGAIAGAITAARQLPGIGTAIDALGFLGVDLAAAFETKSKANWDRTLGRVYRQMVNYRDVDPGIARALYRAWVAAGDKTGAQFWERAVDRLGFPTTKGGTKEGFTRGAPVFDENKLDRAALRAFLAAAKG